MMLNKLLCRIFGHKPPIYKQKGWWSPGEKYARVVSAYPDGIGRVHMHIESKCPRCGITFELCRAHAPWNEKNIKNFHVR